MKPRRRVVPGRPRAADPYPPPRRRSALGGPARPATPAGPPSPSGQRTAAADRPPRPQASPEAVDLSIDLAPRRPGALTLRNPILAASGTFGYGLEYTDLVDVNALGAICTTGTTLRPRVGGRPPQMIETAAGLLSATGRPNPGVDTIVERYAATWAAWRVPVIVDVVGGPVEDVVGVVRRLDGVPGVAGVELDLGGASVAAAGRPAAIGLDGAATLTAAVRRATDVPLLVKVSADTADMRALARTIEAAGADAICAIGPLLGLAIDRERRAPFLGDTYGGLSGPAIKPIALRVVYEVAQAVRIPVVASGGVTGLDDVLDFLMAGASAVQVGSANFADPALGPRLVDQLAAWCADLGLTSFRDLIGAALPARGRTRGKDRRSSTHDAA